MIAVLDAIGLLVIVFANSALTALMTRFFRVRLDTRWGSLLYAVVLCPLVMLVVVFVLSGVLQLGGDLGSPALVVFVTIMLPLAVGLTFDYLWMPAPEEVEIPDTV